MSSPNATILQGHALDILRTLPDASVNCIVTSPPYWGLRSYGTPPQIWDGDPECDHLWELHVQPAANGTSNGEMSGETLSGRSATRKPKRSDFCTKCGAWKGEYGLEPTPELYIKHTLDIFAECWRVLRKDGTCWINLGDCYATGAGAVGDHPGGGKQGLGWKGEGLAWTRRDALRPKGPKTQPNRLPQASLKTGDMAAIPWSVALALRSWGWYLRRDIVWWKTQAMPESVRDRPATAHEYVFLLAKSENPTWWRHRDSRQWSNVRLVDYVWRHKKSGKELKAEPKALANYTRINLWQGHNYWYDADAIKEPASGNAHSRGHGINPKARGVGGWQSGGGTHSPIDYANGHKESRGSHYRAVAEHNGKEPRPRQNESFSRAISGIKGKKDELRELSGLRTAKGLGHPPGWRKDIPQTEGRNARSVWPIPTEAYPGIHFATFPRELPRRCILAGCPIGGTVLDPFGGSGTTCEVALELGRNCITIELQESYLPLIRSRARAARLPLPFAEEVAS